MKYNPTKNQIKAYESNYHDIFPKEPKIYELAAERLRQKESFKEKAKNLKYRKSFITKKPLLEVFR